MTFIINIFCFHSPFLGHSLALYKIHSQEIPKEIMQIKATGLDLQKKKDCKLNTPHPTFI